MRKRGIPNQNRKFLYFCKQYNKQMTMEASIGVLERSDIGEEWHISFSCEQAYCPKAGECARLKPRKYTKSEIHNIFEVMKRIENEC